MPFPRLIRSPGAAAAAICMLALGVAASTAVFTLADALLLKPLPYRDPAQLMALSTRNGGISWQDVRDLVEASTTIEAAAAYTNRTWGLTDGSGSPPAVVLSGMVTEDFFRVLGVDAPDWGSDPRTIWLSHSFWRSRYGTADVTGRRVELNDVAYRVAGLLPEGFRFPMRAGTPEVYIPLDRQVYCCQRDNRGLDAIARRKAGIGLAAASEELPAVSGRLEDRGSVFSATDLRTFLAGQRREPLLLLAAAVAMLMLVAALNAGGILLARAAGNLRESAIKASLGAGWGALVREHLLEGVAIGVAAGALGLAGASLLLAASAGVPAVAEALDGYSRVHALDADGRAALFCFAAAIAAALAASTIPLLLLRRGNLEAMLRGTANASAPRVAVRARQALVVTQVAATVVLLGAGGVLMRSFRNILQTDRGFRTEHVVSAGIGIPEARYDTDEKMIAFHREVIEKLKAIPGVSAAGGGAGMPLGPMSTRMLLAGEMTPLAERPRVDVAVAAPELLGVLGVPLLRGRGFGPQDRWGAPLVALVNQSFVARHLAGRQALGNRMSLGFYNGFAMKPWSEFEIIGVTGDTRSRAADKQPEPMVVLSSLQIPMEGFVYYVKSSRPLGNEIRDAIWSIDRNLQAVRPVPLAERRDRGLEERELGLWLLGAFGAMALVLAGAGLGAVTASAVAESRREIGIRTALGASVARTAARVVRQTATLACAGLVFGLVALAAASRLWQSQLFEVAALDPAAMAGAAVLIMLAVLAAGAVPAWRAARVDPAEVLRG